jgi:hypothetical protein
VIDAINMVMTRLKAVDSLGLPAKHDLKAKTEICVDVDFSFE